MKEYSLEFLKKELEKENSDIINNDNIFEVNYGFLYDNGYKIYTINDPYVKNKYCIIYQKEKNILIKVYESGKIESNKNISSIDMIKKQLYEYNDIFSFKEYKLIDIIFFAVKNQ